MREIKFKGKTINGGWVKGLYSVSNGKTHSTPKKGSYISSRAGAPFAFQIRPETLCQYIGINDKNDVEIYKNDIIKHITFTCIIKYKNGAFYLSVIKGGDTKRDGIFFFYNLNSNLLEVIGNIFDNPELLEKL